MGWSSGGSRVFDPVARALIEAGASDDLKRRTLGPLIDELRDLDWDTQDESLEEFRDDPVIVALFRERGTTDTCKDGGGGEQTTECGRKLGHDGDHVDGDDNSWTDAEVAPA